MANIPNNEQYGTPAATMPQLSPPPITNNISANIGTFLAARGVPYGAGSRNVSPTQATEGQMLQSYGQQNPNAALDQPFLPSQAPAGAEIPIPSDYSGFVPTGGHGDYQWQTPTQPIIRDIGGGNIKGVEPGQYLEDLSNPNALIKGVHGSKPGSPEDLAMLAGRDSRFYQIDHIVPLALGGADTLANKQVQPIGQAIQKDKIESVVYTLYSHGFFGQGQGAMSQARNLMARWPELAQDTTDIPTANGIGLIDYDKAKAFAQRWMTEDTTPEQAKKDFWSSVPQAEKDFGKGWLPDPLREFIKGFGSGASLGFLQYQQGENEGLMSKIAGIAGEVAGGVGTFMVGGEFLDAGLAAAGLGGRALMALRGAQVAAAADAGITTTEAVTEAGTAFKTLNTAPTWIQKVVNPATMKSAAKFGATNALMGQASQLISNRFNPQVFAGTQQPTVEKNMMTNILTDLGTGFAAGLVPGQATLPVVGRILPSGPVSQRIQGAAIAMAPVTLGSFILDPYHPVNALTDGAMFGAMHLLGTSGVMSASEKTANQDMIVKAFNDTANRAAYHSLSYYNPDMKALSGTGEVPMMNPEQIQAAQGSAIKNLQTRFLLDTDAEGKPVAQPGMDLGTYQAEMDRIVAAGRQLSKESLSPDAKQQANVDDLLSFGHQALQDRYNKQSSFANPPIVAQAADSLDDDLMRKSFNENSFDTPSGQYPTGDIALTGAGIDANTPQARYFFSQKAKGKASPTILLVDRPDTAPVWRMKNDLITDEQVKSGSYAPDPNPEHAVQAFGISINDQGNKEMVPLGWIASPFRMNDATNPKHRAFNQHPAVLNGDFPPLELHKDDIAPAMRQHGIQVLAANLDYRATPITKESGLPFIPVNVNDQNWEFSKSLNEKLSADGKVTNPISANVARVRTSLNAKAKSQAISEIKAQVQAPAHEVLPDTPSPKASVSIPQATTREVLATAANALEARSPQNLKDTFQQKLGVFLSEEQSKDLFDNRSDLTASDVLGVISDAIEGGQTDGRLGPVMTHFIKPYLESDTFKGGQLAKVFPQLRALGGVAQRTAKVVSGAPEADLPPNQVRLSPKEVKGLQKQGFDDATIQKIEASQVSPAETGGSLEDRMVQEAASMPAPGRSLLEGPFAEEPREPAAVPEGAKVRDMERYASFGNEEDPIAQGRNATSLADLPNPLEAQRQMAREGVPEKTVLQSSTGYRLKEMPPVTMEPAESMNHIERGLQADKSSPAYAHALAMDSVLKTIYGVRYRTNPEAQAIMSDPSFWQNKFSNETNAEGREITQKKDVIKNFATGDKTALDKSIQERRSEVGNANETPTTPGTSHLDPLGGEMNVTPDVQNQDMVHDLTYGESRLMPGIATDEPLTSAQAIRDVKTLWLGTGKNAPGLLQHLNAMRIAKGLKKVSLPMQLFKSLESRAKATDKRTAGAAPAIADAEQQLVNLGKTYTSLMKAWETAPDTALEPAIEDVRTAIADIQKRLKK